MSRKKRSVKDIVGTDIWEELKMTIRVGRHICVRLDINKYVFWSNNVDAPVTYIMPYSEAIETMKLSAEMLDISGVENRIDRLERIGTTDLLAHNAEETYRSNYAGPNGECLTIKGLLKFFQEDPGKLSLDKDDVVQLYES